MGSANSKQKRIAVMGRKGGTGKTTLARTIIEYFALVKGKTVLGVDCDNQCNLSRLFLPMELAGAVESGLRPPLHPDREEILKEDPEFEGRSSSADVFYRGRVYPYPAQHPEGVKNIDILPGQTDKLGEVEEQDKNEIVDKVENRLRELFTLPGVEERYEIVVFDTGPSGTPLARSVLHAATHFIVPVEPEPQGTGNLALLAGMYRKEYRRREKGDELINIGFQVNRYRSKENIHVGTLESLRRDPLIGPLLTPKPIPQRTAFIQRDSKDASPRSIFQLPKNNEARVIAEEFGEYVESKLYGSGTT